MTPENEEGLGRGAMEREGRGDGVRAVLKGKWGAGGVNIV